MCKRNCKQIFLKLIAAGLWGDRNADMQIDEAVDWDYIYQLAQEQSVQGLVLQGIEAVREKGGQLQGSTLVSSDLLLQWIGDVQIIEQQNKEMNAFIAVLIEKLQRHGIYALLVKGQGIAQCYERPLWRVSGDVDLLLNEKNYCKAKDYLCQKASSIDEENKYQHLGMIIDGWNVEIHGTLRSGLLKRMDAIVDEVQYNTFNKGNTRVWRNDKTDVFLPNPDDDIIFVFTHIIKHFFHEGIGLRQICDWCKLVYAYRDSLNYGLLESRIKEAGLMSEWKAFAACAVEYLGMPMDAMPLFDEKDSHSNRLKRKADKICEFILMAGNFGHNRDFSYYGKKSLIKKKINSFTRHTCDSLKKLAIFPLDTMTVWNRMLIKGIQAII